MNLSFIRIEYKRWMTLKKSFMSLKESSNFFAVASMSPRLLNFLWF
jgi:hypothetical protein